MFIASVTSFLVNPYTFASFLPSIPLDSLFSTQGIMVMLLAAYAGAMWMFLTSAPKVYTVMVSDLEIARQLYEGLLDLPAAEVPLHYYYNYEQTIGATAVDPLYLGSSPSFSNKMTNASEGLWYQLKKNTQLHVITGASLGSKNQQRHVCFDHECMEMILMRVEVRGLKFKIRSRKPLNFLVKDYEGRIIEMAEVAN
ncbi:glyoxalase-like domain protein [Fischerella thermalis CCMEE 5330]|uniref:Glyoxalase-like domain protein n=1 Tax=Fischerella thermalis CCMEE 5330 TaxID=2019670 RepID=A0A2N6ML44_9CYAN|nr:glyoxalase-like domain protein [Fischerella thermalis]PMB47448.1 glyoxalase-like domain protein [Fischerella thermalis CCMEE 5330]